MLVFVCWQNVDRELELCFAEFVAIVIVIAIDTTNIYSI
jgi:hypothetical protein